MLSHLIYSEYREISLYIFESRKRKSGMETSGSHHRFLVFISDSVRDSQERTITSKVSNSHPTVTSGQRMSYSRLMNLIGKNIFIRKLSPLVLLPGSSILHRVGLFNLRYNIEKHAIKFSYSWRVQFFCITKLNWLSFSTCESKMLSMEKKHNSEVGSRNDWVNTVIIFFRKQNYYETCYGNNYME